VVKLHLISGEPHAAICWQLTKKSCKSEENNGSQNKNKGLGWNQTYIHLIASQAC
jgi:hypothetical protein